MRLPVPIIPLVLATLGFGCTSLGPSVILNGREAYNNAIRTTENQQLLLFLVRQRYGEFGGLLAVTSVTANMRYATRATVNVGFGDDDDFVGNLVPFEGGIIYEENPIISYTPVQGERFVRQLLLPLPLDLVVLSLHSSAEPKAVIRALIKRVNGIANPRFLYSSEQIDARFDELSGILTELQLRDRIEWERNPNDRDFSLLIRRNEGENPLVDRLHDLLGLTAADEQAAFLRYPLIQSTTNVAGSIAISTRSVWDLVQIMTSAVEVTDEEMVSGRTFDYPMRSPFATKVRIVRSQGEPPDASVKVKYRDAWYSIADTDKATKSAFQLLQTLWSVRIADTTAAGQGAPLVTVPAGR
ncbi:MAG: hypothetical protein ACYTG5_07910 [Planctomycetota bacterium]|jgi:hypothetical protein